MIEESLKKFSEKLDAKGLAILTVFGIAGFTGDIVWDFADFLDPEFVGPFSGAIPATFRAAAHQQYNESKTKKRRKSLVNNVKKLRKNFSDAGDKKACERLDRQVNAWKLYHFNEQGLGRALEEIYEDHLRD